MQFPALFYPSHTPKLFQYSTPIAPKKEVKPMNNLQIFNSPDCSIRVTRTVKATGKGQQYFINLFLADGAAV